jgi:uroporphyrinogen decarboxylase
MALSGKPILDVLAGHKTDKIPFWLMRQAGRYLPEYRELRAKKKGFFDMAFDPDSACEITMQPIRRFQMDAAIIFSDILVIPHALGQKVEFLQGEGPKLEPMRGSKDFTKLNFKDFESRLEPVYEALRRTRKSLSLEGFNQTTLIGFSGAPWTLACYMIEGGGSKDFMHVKKIAYADPKGFSALIEILTESISAYLIKKIDAGAEAVKIFDSWAGVLDAHEFIKWVVKPTRDIVSHVKSMRPHVPIIGFPRAAGYNYLSYAQETGISAIAIDSMFPTRTAARTLQTMMPVQGNLDPACLLAGGDAMTMSVEKILADLKNGPFIFNLGHGVHKDTPPEHVSALAAQLRRSS